jgi:hypothetical protein
MYIPLLNLCSPCCCNCLLSQSFDVTIIYHAYLSYLSPYTSPLFLLHMLSLMYTIFSVHAKEFRMRYTEMKKHVNVLEYFTPVPTFSSLPKWHKFLCLCQHIFYYKKPDMYFIITVWSDLFCRIFTKIVYCMRYEFFLQH